jgi:hypothetical protein
MAEKWEEGDTSPVGEHPSPLRQLASAVAAECRARAIQPDGRQGCRGAALAPSA